MSAKIALLSGEQIVMSSDKETLLLTTKRVRYDAAVPGRSKFISITLDAVASCSLAMKSFPVLLLFAAAALIGAIIQRDATFVLFVLAAILAAAYFFTRRAVISIASCGGEKILVPAKNMNRTAIIEFLEAIEQQKLQSKK